MSLTGTGHSVKDWLEGLPGDQSKVTLRPFMYASILDLCIVEGADASNAIKRVMLFCPHVLLVQKRSSICWQLSQSEAAPMSDQSKKCCGV